jgi:hypothetical protein
MKEFYEGQVRYIVFKEGDAWYAAGLEFNIVESGDDPRIAFNNLVDAVEGYVEAARKFKDSQLLIQETDPEYEKLWTAASAATKTSSSFPVSMVGVIAI